MFLLSVVPIYILAQNLSILWKKMTAILHVLQFFSNVSKIRKISIVMILISMLKYKFLINFDSMLESISSYKHCSPGGDYNKVCMSKHSAENRVL